MSLFRSDEMGYFSLAASKEYAWDILNELGELDALQFVDLNAEESNFKRPYSNYLRRCEDLENKLNNIENYMNKFDLPIERCEDPKEFLRHLKHAIEARNKVERTYLDDVEGEINDRMAMLSEQIKSYETLIENYNHLVEYREVLAKTRQYIQGENMGEIQGEISGGDPYAVRGDIRFQYLAGVINKEDSLRFRKILFRITRGMTYTALIDIPKPQNDLDRDHPNYFLDSAKNIRREKTVFLVVYQGGEHGMLKGKLDRICDAFGASKYGIPVDTASFTRKMNEIETQLLDSQGVVQKTKGLIGSILQYFSDPIAMNHQYSHIEGLKLFILKEKTLYHNLNMLRPQNVLNIGNCWCPLDKVGDVQNAIQRLSRRKGDIGSCEFREIRIPEGVSPPTHFKTNSVTFVFQEIVNTYGVPRYREINPGLFTVATFPFLFGVMFGDIMHGALLFVAGAYLLLYKEKIEKEKDSLWNMALPARYLLLFEGFFAFYCGLIYNDFTSVPFNLFGTCYTKVDDHFVQTKDCTYTIGIDPNWYGKDNELTFLNSYKMKLAIVLGVTHMLFGILLRGLNNIFSRKMLDFICEFIPMLVFMSVTFGYMVFLIILKWSLPWSVDNPDYLPRDAPSIITIFIKMALLPGKWDPTVGRSLYGDREGNTQATVQLMFLVAALICAFIILLPKPIILNCRNSSNKASHHHNMNDSGYNANEHLLERNHDENQVLIDPMQKRMGQSDKVEKHSEEEHGFGELFVHQVIETIEFVLGSISNTASYLRLWALSLAHSQLAKVFFDNTIGRGITGGNPLMILFMSHAFAQVTFGVLMLMDQMECFLHALRLHWVEFQNKFYKADGYGFVPFSFGKALKQGE